MIDNKIPILFLQDDESLIEMYQSYFEARGYNSILIRGGKNALELAMNESPALLTLDAQETLTRDSDKPPIYIFTYQRLPYIQKNFDLKSAVISSEVFNELKSSYELT